jgi:TRAP-type C4-dicarboxylate transport system permease small subunit
MSLLAKVLNRVALAVAGRLLVTFAQALNSLALAIASLLVVLIFVVAGLGVIFRYVLQHSLPWADEAAAYLFIWLIFLGAASEVWTDGHPAMHLFEDRLPPRLRRTARIVAMLTIAVWGGVLLFSGIKAVILEAPESMSSLPGVSLQLPYAAIPVCGALIIIFALAKLRTR